METRMLQGLREGKQVVGTFCHLGGSVAAECLSLSKLDCFVIDTEHGPFSEETVSDMIRSAQLYGCGALVRPRDSSRAAVLHMLDVGCAGLIVPDIRSVREVRDLVESCKYFPMGRRGFAFARSAGYGTDARLRSGVQPYFDGENRDTLLLPQCETAEMLDAIEEIMAIDGVDGVFVGPYDLSVALENPADFSTEAYRGAIARIVRAAKAHKKWLFIYANDTAAAQAYFAQGFDAVMIGTDTDLLIKSCNALRA